MALDPDLAARVQRLLADYLDDGEPVDPAATPVVIRAGTAQVLVRLVDAEPPVLRLYSPLLRTVASTPALLADLNEINAHLSFLRLFWRDGTVYAATELLAASTDGPALTHSCDAITELSDYYDERLHRTHGGRLSYR